MLQLVDPDAAAAAVFERAVDLGGFAVKVQLDPARVIADVGPPNIGHHFVVLTEPVDDRVVSSVTAERQAHCRPRHCRGQPPATAGTMERSSLSFSGVLSPDPNRRSSSFRSMLINWRTAPCPS